MQTPSKWKEYELLDSGDGMKLERWGHYIVARPDPAALWPKKHNPLFWGRANATFERSIGGKGCWIYKEKMPARWQVNYEALSFWVRPTDSKHVGLFPEQGVNWSWMQDQLLESRGMRQEARVPKILNLFGYTGGATLACVLSGAEVTHVDASKGVMEWAKENYALTQNSLPRNNTTPSRPSPGKGNGLCAVRWIVDDVMKFVAREERRGARYDGIIMDPPSYGRGKRNELWKIEEMLRPLLEKCEKILSPFPLFCVVNSYTTGLPRQTVENMLRATLACRGGTFTSDELGLQPKDGGWILPAGSTVRWSRPDN
ncbi:MAG: SAM-dependent methyltransferase [Candidatus Vogelbacteria bacterium CG10_big_fil_rev_8_21_14_0_10_51_16]|uniref:SAM-dependent methyltransferase n=1 Tax=Candidatus Vogelbacteria bacterium CG10_big_fil_rev_8_21_14_0_10_51_16 TaxID=1975045 RepID=A0A2H0RE71_9BACT|nr:MAG: SAM-dependent methyltransferase [Candidatus Vogelbacteria bacterium CG10_big_fil_rev_8_21_14_0_10_51_16]